MGCLSNRTEIKNDLDDVWKWLGYSQKIRTKKLLNTVFEKMIKITNHCFLFTESKQLTSNVVTTKKYLCCLLRPSNNCV